MPARTLFVTGTDTGVGKTHVTCALLRHLRCDGISACGFKPISCGDREDARLLMEAAGNGDLDEVNPLWFETPAAPFVAEKVEAKPFNRPALFSAFRSLYNRYDWVVIEGAGGWEVPVTAQLTFADLAEELDAPVVVVAANRLGTLNHTLLTCQAIESRNLTCSGIVLNQPVPSDSHSRVATETNLEALKALLPGTPVTQVGNGETSLDPLFLKSLGF